MLVYRLCFRCGSFVCVVCLAMWFVLKVVLIGLGSYLILDEAGRPSPF